MSHSSEFIGHSHLSELFSSTKFNLNEGSKNIYLGEKIDWRIVADHEEIYP